MDVIKKEIYTGLMRGFYSEENFYGFITTRERSDWVAQSGDRQIYHCRDVTVVQTMEAPFLPFKKMKCRVTLHGAEEEVSRVERIILEGAGNFKQF